MKLKLLIYALLLPLCFSAAAQNEETDEASGFVQAPDVVERMALESRVRSLLNSNQFEALDALAAQSRRSKKDYPGGVWELDEFYAALKKLPKESTNAEWEQRFTVLNQWKKERPHSITARVALASVWVSYAWKARGNGYAQKVTDVGWRLYALRLASAKEVLLEAKNLPEKCPWWWATMQEIALGQGWELPAYDALFREALRFEPRFHAYYTHKSWYLQPRWHGEEGDWVVFIEKSANDIGGEDGDVFYARMVWNMHITGVYRRNIFMENPQLSWPRVKRGFEILQRRYADMLKANNEFCHLAVLAGDKETARKLFKELQGKIYLPIWGKKEKFLRLYSSVME